MLKLSPLPLALVALVLAGAAPAATPQDGQPEVPADTKAIVGDPFAASSEIAAIGFRIGHQPGGAEAKADAIVRFIFTDRDGLAFTYRRAPTLVASDAMRERAGNCLTLVNLFISLARTAGLEATPVEVEDFVSFSRDGETVLRSTHVIAGITTAGGVRTYDFLPGKDKSYRRMEPISDRRHTALVANAMAVEAMLGGRYQRAGEFFREALELDPSSADIWNNYALLARRMSDLEAATARLERALELDRRSVPALTNLARIYRVEGLDARAAELEQRALMEKEQNPYFLIEQAVLRLRSDDLEGATRLLRQARRIDATIPDIYVVAGRVDLARGDTAAADREFQTARARSEELSAAYRKSLDRKIADLLAK